MAEIPIIQENADVYEKVMVSLCSSATTKCSSRVPSVLVVVTLSTPAMHVYKSSRDDELICVMSRFWLCSCWCQIRTPLLLRRTWIGAELVSEVQHNDLCILLCEAVTKSFPGVDLEQPLP